MIVSHERVSRRSCMLVLPVHKYFAQVIVRGAGLFIQLRLSKPDT